MISIILKTEPSLSVAEDAVLKGIHYIQRVRKFRGCKAFRLYRDIELADSLFFYSDWASAEVLLNYAESGVFRNLWKIMNLRNAPVWIDLKLISETASSGSFLNKSGRLTAASVEDLEFLLPRLFSQTRVEGESHIAKEKYASSNLSKLQVDEYLKHILDYTKEQKPFLDKQITIKSFGEAIAIHPHHISRVINEKLGMNFSNYINQYRIEYAKEVIHNGLLDIYTISGVGREAGFNSKSAFYNAFRKCTGMTPREYIQGCSSLQKAQAV